MSFSEFIYQELTENGTIDEEIYSPGDITRDMLLQETDLEETDILDLETQYEEYCEMEGIEPDMDVQVR